MSTNPLPPDDDPYRVSVDVSDRRPELSFLAKLAFTLPAAFAGFTAFCITCGAASAITVAVPLTSVGVPGSLAITVVAVISIIVSALATVAAYRNLTTLRSDETQEVQDQQ